jgi:hypothetical protein
LDAKGAKGDIDSPLRLCAFARASGRPVANYPVVFAGSAGRLVKYVDALALRSPVMADGAVRTLDLGRGCHTKQRGTLNRMGFAVMGWGGLWLAGVGQPVLEECVAVFGQDGLGVELYALYRQVGVAQAHDDALAAGGYF